MLRALTLPRLAVASSLVSFALVAVSACSSTGTGGAPSGAAPAAGEPGGPCYGNDTCNPPAQCDKATRTCSTQAKVGDEKGPCYPNGTCNPGLTCLSQLCVKAGGAGGTGGSSSSAGGTGGTSAAGGSGGAPQGAGGSTFGGGGSSGAGGDTCAGTAYAAKQAPAALLVVLDRSSSMATKWAAASGAVTDALDQDIFDTMSVGLYSAPTGQVAGPQCIFGLPVACQAPTSPQIPLQEAGAGKSTAPGGVRASIKQFLSYNAPMGGILDADASPLYAGVQAGLDALKAWPQKGKRLMLVVTDGTISCTSVANPPRPAFSDANGCQDWEDPNNIVALLKAAHDDGAAPINSFIVGVPGSDTYDPSGAMYPPYPMLLALSAMASAGAPEFVDPACDGKDFSQAGMTPSKPCHFDMSKGVFSAADLSGIISKVRTKALGCIFEPPIAPDGQTIDPTQVNVSIDLGMGQVDVLKRSDPADTCSNYYCWDYTSEGKIELIGLTCDDLKNAGKSSVSILAGCETREIK